MAPGQEFEGPGLPGEKELELVTLGFHSRASIRDEATRAPQSSLRPRPVKAIVMAS